MNPERFGEPCEINSDGNELPKIDPIIEPNWDDPESSEIIEAKRPEIKFIGEDAEVTVKRSNGRLEGGWEVLGPDKEKEGHLIVANREQQTKKVMKIESLLKLQPFQEGDNVAVIRSDGKVDSEGWTVTEKAGYGYVEVGKIIDGKFKTKIVKKSRLIMAKIAELKLREDGIRKWGDITSADRKIIAKITEDVEYWQDKLKTVEAINNKVMEKMFQESSIEREDKTPSAAA